MRIEIHTIPNKDIAERLCWIERALGLILTKQEMIMTTLSDIQAKQALTDAAVAQVKADVEAMVAKIAAFPIPGLTPEQQAAIDDIGSHADSINTALGVVAAEANPPAA